MEDGEGEEHNAVLGREQQWLWPRLCHAGQRGASALMVLVAMGTKSNGAERGFERELTVDA